MYFLPKNSRFFCAFCFKLSFYQLRLMNMRFYNLRFYIRIRTESDYFLLMNNFYCSIPINEHKSIHSVKKRKPLEEKKCAFSSQNGYRVSKKWKDKKSKEVLTLPFIDVFFQGYFQNLSLIQKASSVDEVPF